jgi:hypothetical protein
MVPPAGPACSTRVEPVVVADNAKEAKAHAKAKWSGAGRGHVDAVQQIDMVDGFEISLAKVGTGDRTALDDDN